MRRAALGVVFLLTLFAMSVAGVVGEKFAKWAFPWPRPTTERLIEAIEIANKKLPMVVDGHTRMDRAQYSPATNVVRYDYTLLNVETALPGHFAEVEKKARPALVSQACTVDRLLDMGVTNVYSYKAADGTFFGSVTVTKADCKR
jgi:hypothetical protein